MEEADPLFGFSPGTAPPSVVTLSPFSPIPVPSSRRLSSHFIPSRPVPSARRLAWVSLRGRLVNAEEASSAKAIGLSREETVAWELFSPIQRFLIVAVIGVAVAESKKNLLISQLKKSVDLRDQVLSNMQQKLDDLCEQVNSIKNHSRPEANASFNKNTESLSSDAFGGDKIKFVDCGCWHCDHHYNLFADPMGNAVMKTSRGDEVLQYKTPLVNEVEQEERRMSDLSDWASSVSSTADIQMNMSAVDHDIYNLKKECEEKDATIKELTTVLQSKNMAGSKRTAELEDIIHRKNSTIAKLKRDILVLEQKLVHLTRLRRPSSSEYIPESWQLPLMMENIVYDMDSTTSPSSSDSDSSPVNRSLAPVVKNQAAPVQNSTNSSFSSDTDAPQLNQQLCHIDRIPETPLHGGYIAPTTHRKSAPAKALVSFAKLTEQKIQSGPVSPLKESTNQNSGRVSSLRSKQVSASGEFKKIRRRTQTASNNAAPKKKWV
ncbi:uncharacterized protein LOC8274407 isoform X2 [Ricinus communis]|uniref:uncharacterized protein LOC8274407 isoform X2 n=1 Tax=Ricinus communis TaxID=3988 RepID=UPI000772B3A8|nr:uncharacterized protein LOC8274407 isoform X2 [Ricinus communis]|eukprot:XP_015571372.1 uncharacterized protein LOC8274407 isoform X2 [Ricinus communis]